MRKINLANPRLAVAQKLNSSWIMSRFTFSLVLAPPLFATAQSEALRSWVGTNYLLHKLGGHWAQTVAVLSVGWKDVSWYAYAVDPRWASEAKNTRRRCVPAAASVALPSHPLFQRVITWKMVACPHAKEMQADVSERIRFLSGHDECILNLEMFLVFATQTHAGMCRNPGSSPGSGNLICVDLPGVIWLLIPGMDTGMPF